MVSTARNEDHTTGLADAEGGEWLVGFVRFTLPFRGLDHGDVCRNDRGKDVLATIRPELDALLVRFDNFDSRSGLKAFGYELSVDSFRLVFYVNDGCRAPGAQSG